VLYSKPSQSSSQQFGTENHTLVFNHQHNLNCPRDLLDHQRKIISKIEK